MVLVSHIENGSPWTWDNDEFYFQIMEGTYRTSPWQLSKFDDAGNEVGSPFLVGTQQTNYLGIKSIDVAALETGEFAVTWSYSGGNSWGTSFGYVYLQVFDKLATLSAREKI